ncbi:MAG: fibronectin type III domain-containing protein [Candidatus Diapherotrites archaeon]|nr:fibronectin type III domain-containing protein [Candidatus Diapherotrites archaeon]
MFKKKFVLGLILALFLLAGCTTGNQDIQGFAKQLPEVQAFLNQHPGAEIKVLLMDANTVQQNIQFIEEKCGGTLPIQSYYQVTVEENNAKIYLWMTPDKQVQCISREVTEESTSTEDSNENTTAECRQNIDCEDNQNYTNDFCNNGICVHPRITECTNNDNYCPTQCSYSQDKDCTPECTSNASCEDVNPNTLDTCDLNTYICTHTLTRATAQPETESRIQDANTHQRQNQDDNSTQTTTVRTQSCENQNGYSCLNTQTCAGNWLTANNASYCCAVMCTNPTDSNTNSNSNNSNLYALSMSTPQASSITSTSATITWTTTGELDGKLKYSTNQSQVLSGPQIIGSCCSTHHSITIGGLNPGTQYYFAVYSTFPSGSPENVSAIYSFTTQALQSNIISNIQVTNITSNSAAITWKTNTETVGEIHYNYSSTWATTAPETVYSLDHTAQLTGLNSGTSHNYTIYTYTRDVNIRTEDTAVKSSQSTFTTLQPPPVISNATIILDGVRGIYASWQTNVAADATVHINSNQSQLGTGTDKVFYNPNQWQDRKIVLSGLTANTTYYYTLSSTNSNGTTTTQPATYTVPAAITISNVNVTFGTMSGIPVATFTWNSSVSGSTGVTFSNTDPNLGYSNGPTGIADSSTGTSHSITTGFNAGQMYYYKVFSISGSNFGESSISTFTMPN